MFTTVTSLLLTCRLLCDSSEGECFQLKIVLLIPETKLLSAWSCCGFFQTVWTLFRDTNEHRKETMQQNPQQTTQSATAPSCTSQLLIIVCRVATPSNNTSWRHPIECVCVARTSAHRWMDRFPVLWRNRKRGCNKSVTDARKKLMSCGVNGIFYY